MSGIESWSTNPANNNQSPPFGWPAGMLPSQVEPTARQDMASIAAWYQAAEWINYNLTPTYVSGTQFTLTGNDTVLYHVGRRVKATDGSTNVYGTITASAFTTLTTVTVAWDSGVLQTGVTIVYVGITSAVNTSSPALSASAFANPSASVGLTAVNGTATTAMRSDAAPALSQAISPTWSGNHTFSNAITVNGAGSSLKGGVTVVAPSSGVGITVNGTASSYAGLFTAGGAAGTQKGLSVVTTTQNAADRIINANNSISNLFDIFGDGHGDLGPNLSWTTAGNWSIGAATSGAALAVSGAANVSALTVAGNSTSGQSKGIFVNAGTNSSDFSLLVQNLAGSANYFQVRGDGLTQAIDQGGALQDVGWRGTPLNSPAGSYTIALSDRGKTVFTANGATITVPSATFSAGDVVTILTGTLSTATIAQGSGMTLIWAGNGNTTGGRTMNGAAIATLVFFNSAIAFISGAGLS